MASPTRTIFSSTDNSATYEYKHSCAADFSALAVFAKSHLSNYPALNILPPFNKDTSPT